MMSAERVENSIVNDKMLQAKIMKIVEKQGNRQETGKTEGIFAGLSYQKRGNLDFEKMKSFLKTEIKKSTSQK